MDRHEPQPGSDPTSSSAARWRLSQGTQTHSAAFTDDPEDDLVDIRHNQGEVGGGRDLYLLQCWHAWLRRVVSVEAYATDQVVTHPSQPPQNHLTRLEILRRAKYFDAKEAGAAAADRLPRSLSTRSFASDGHTHGDNGSTYQSVPPARDVSLVRKRDIIQQSGCGSWDLSGGLSVCFVLMTQRRPRSSSTMTNTLDRRGVPPAVADRTTLLHTTNKADLNGLPGSTKPHCHHNGHGCPRGKSDGEDNKENRQSRQGALDVLLLTRFFSVPVTPHLWSLKRMSRFHCISLVSPGWRRGGWGNWMAHKSDSVANAFREKWNFLPNYPTTKKFYKSSEGFNEKLKDFDKVRVKVRVWQSYLFVLNCMDFPGCFLYCAAKSSHQAHGDFFFENFSLSSPLKNLLKNLSKCRKSSPWGIFSDGGLNQSIKRRLPL